MKNTLILKKIKSLPTPKNPKLLKKLILKSKPVTLSDAVAVLVNDKGEVIGASAKALVVYESRIKQLISATGFKGKIGECVTDFAVNTDSKQPSMPIMLVGVGKYTDNKKLADGSVAKIANAIYQHAKSRLLKVSILVGDALGDTQSAQFALALLNASYRFDKYKSDKSDVALKEVDLLADNLDKQSLSFVNAIFKGQSLTRDVANEPGNVCFPKYMAKQAQQLAKAHSDVLKVTVLGEKKMEQLGMGCFMAVSRGSAQEGQMVILEYSGHSKFADNSVANLAADLKEAVTNKLPLNQTIKKFEQGLEEVIDSATHAQKESKTAGQYQAPIALVGKGVTFDTGGISLKPGAGMEEMKFDMGGAASVLGTIKALCESRLPINVVGVLACAENMPAGNATRPGDIVQAMDGTSVEILNTDAEGRLVLADALCYVQRYNPKAVIDVATLTGACVIALGHLRSAVYSNDEDVLFELQNASAQTGDLIWHMPLDEAYHEQLKSPIADLQNIGGRPAGSITAASFLSSFIKDNTAWAHLDIAGTAWVSGKDRNATGRPVPLFMQYLKNMAQATPLTTSKTATDKPAKQPKADDSNNTDNTEADG